MREYRPRSTRPPMKRKHLRRRSRMIRSWEFTRIHHAPPPSGIVRAFARPSMSMSDRRVGGLTMAETTYLEAIRQGLFEEMDRDPEVICLGEDIGKYGGA